MMHGRKKHQNDISYSILSLLFSFDLTNGTFQSKVQKQWGKSISFF
jgi:hypothetical protein